MSRSTCALPTIGWLRWAGEMRRDIPTPVQAIVFDFDGVMTDNRAFVSSNGEEGVFVDRGDGHGIRRLREESNVALLVLPQKKVRSFIADATNSKSSVSLELLTRHPC